MVGKVWESPDGRIRKEIITSGISELKPTENCHCSIKISNYNAEMENYSSISSATIGDSDNNFERFLHDCLLTMNVKEIARITFKTKSENCFTLELLSLESNGQIYEWNASEKCNLTLKHKAKGIELFSQGKYIDASHRFSKGLKILCSIPIEVDESPKEVDGVKVIDIKSLKLVLYNNLASCYLKHCDYETVLKLCTKVLEKDKDNVKALYKQAVAKCETHDYEGSKESFLHILNLEPENKAAAEKLKFINMKVAEANAKVNAMIKKMFTH